MHTRRNIYFIVGVLLIAINLLLDVIELMHHAGRSTSTAYSIGYFIGSNIFLIFGLVLLRLGYKLHREIKLQQELQQRQVEIDLIGQ